MSANANNTIVYTTLPEPDDDRFMKTARHFRITPLKLPVHDATTNLGRGMKPVYEALKLLGRDIEYVLWVDGRTTFFQAGLTQICDVYNAMMSASGRVLFGASHVTRQQQALDIPAELDNKYPLSPTKNWRLVSGAWMGKRLVVTNALHWMLSAAKGDERDEHFWNLLYADGKNDIRLDHHAMLFFDGAGPDTQHRVITKHGVGHADNDMRPCIVHAEQPAIYRSLFDIATGEILKVSAVAAPTPAPAPTPVPATVADTRTPLLSLFTPTNNPRYLGEALQSIKRQNYANWEWVLLVNGDVTPQAVKQMLIDDPSTRDMADDPRIRILQARPSDKIGDLKRQACDASKGSVFVEFDHDDMLVPDTLPKIAKAVNEGAGFVFSDSAVFEDDLQSWGYHPSHGWQHYTLTVYGKKFTVTKCFDVSPRMLCEVYYAPDHVRAWERAAYYKAGGHDTTMSVGDDHDLICRTYLAAAKFTHIGACGYLYRWHASNTVKARGTAIAKQTAENKRNHLMNIVMEWCRRNEYKRIDLLQLHRDGKWDYEDPLPLAANSYGQIMASDVLQFVPPARQFEFFNTVYTALKPGGFVHVAVPSESGRYASQNPLHRTRFNLNSFLAYSRKEFALSTGGDKIKCRFDLTTNEEFYPSADFKKYGMLMIRADLCAMHGQNHPGPTLI